MTTTTNEETEEGETTATSNANAAATPTTEEQAAKKEAATSTTEDQAAEKEEDSKKDEEGLELKYDVIICGTGLVQSILASALTRAGKTVLHCDGNDHYGELDTVWTFEYLQELMTASKQQKNDTPQNPPNDENYIICLSEQGSYQSLEFHSSGSNTEFPIAIVGTTVQTPYGQGKITEITLPENSESENGHLVISLDNWTMADGSHPLVYIGISKSQLEVTSGEQTVEDFMRQQYPGIQSLRTLAARKILQQQSRSLALDVTPQLLYASGTAVEGFLTSGVAEHLEFQTMQAVYWLQNNDSSTNNNKKKKRPTLERVPCSKGDVFQSPLLPPLDKRRFMKFFQLAMDYATEREMQQQEDQQQGGSAEQSSAESTTSTAPTTEDNTDEGVLSLNERQLNQGRSLARPQNKAVSQKDMTTLHECMDKKMEFEMYLEEHAKLSPQLRQLIRHALALEIGTDDNKDAATATLSTKEGMGRLCDHLKALGRYGTTAFLTPLYGAGELSQFFCRSAAVYGATYLLRRVPTQVNLVEGDNGTKRVDSVTICSKDEEAFGGMGPIPKEKKIQATHVVLAQEARLHTTCQKRLIRRVSVLRGNVVPATTRSVIVIPPHGVGSHKYAIHGLVLDESARVAPAGCSLLHLTTVIDENDAVDSDDPGCLENALRVILESSSSSEPAVDEIFYSTFSYGIYDNSDNNDTCDLHEIKRPPMPLAIDEAFDQARHIFRQICGPDEIFLALSSQMEARLKEQLQDAYRGPNQVEDDDEQHVLDSAMGMLS